MPKPPKDSSVTTPSPARLYDYLLGGTDNYAIDRQTAEHVLSKSPQARESAVQNRRFLVRAVEHMGSKGIRQFLDLGSGLPTAENTHQVAQRVDSDVRVVYVDRDPAVLAHAKALLGSQHSTAYVHADVRNVDAVLGAPETRRLLDLSQPVGLLAVAVLHFVDDEDDPAGLMRTYTGHLAAGSYVAVTSASRTGLDAEMLALTADASERYRFPVHLRAEEEIAAMFGGVELEPPGLVPVQDWPSPQGGGALAVPILGGVGRVR